MSRYDDLLTEQGRTVLQRIYPSAPMGSCPAAADAVDDYLNGGNVQEVSPYSSSTYDIVAHWQATSLQHLRGVVQRMGADHHVTVRGTRPASSSMARTHYFILANIGGTVHVVDATTHEVNPDVQGYYNRQEFNQLEYSMAFETTAQFQP